MDVATAVIRFAFVKDIMWMMGEEKITITIAVKVVILLILASYEHSADIHQFIEVKSV